MVRVYLISCGLQKPSVCSTCWMAPALARKPASSDELIGTGNNPSTRLLLLHGGPGGTHEYFEACDSFLPAAGIEYYYYDQLGSTSSDPLADPSLLDVDRFVDEVDQVRDALGLTSENFFLLGH